MRKIGITTTVPVEIIYAAGAVPVDLNNLFITSPEPLSLIQIADEDGYPANVCKWIKGIYGAVKKYKIDEIVVVIQGDCTNTHALAETLETRGVYVHTFSYPHDRNKEALREQMEQLCKKLGARWDDVLEWKKKLDRIREKVRTLDSLTHGYINHLYQLMCSDFCQDPERFEKDLEKALSSIKRNDDEEDVRIGYIGVPPIITGFYEYLEEEGAKVVFNEMQFQFSMPYLVPDIVEQYREYSYPYGIFFRIEKIKEQIKKRRIEALIHYVQSFCFRQIEDVVLRKKLHLPILTIEADSPGPLDKKAKMRISAFISMLKERKNEKRRKKT